MQQAPSVQGKITFINPVRQISDRFRVAEIGIRNSNFNNGTVYTNDFGFQASSNLADDIQNLNIGDEIVIEFGIRGTYKEYPDQQGTEKNPNAAKCITNVNIANLRVINSAQPQPQNQQNQQSNVNQQQNTGGNYNPAPENADDLPF